MKLIRKFSGQTIRGSVYKADALDLLGSINDGSAALVFVDPPFNLGKKYTHTLELDNRSSENYVAWMHSILDQCVRILEPGGALFLYHVPSWALRFGAYLHSQLEFRHWIAVSMKNGFVRGRRLYPAHYALLYFVKGKPKFFHRPKTQPLRCRHCSKLVKDYGGYWGIVQKKGINLSDFWEDISPVRHSNTKTRAENELPLKLTERVVAISGRKGKLFVDPFAGGGSALIAAAKRGMLFIGGDIVEKNAQLTGLRLAGVKELFSKPKPANVKRHYKR